MHTIPFDCPVTQLIRERFSCRTYLEQPIQPEKRQRLQDLMAALRVGPLGTASRFKLVAATEQDSSALSGLGTYGFIKGARGFMAGAITPAAHDLEDYGYLMETLILFATGLDLGTCWLGGSFTRSSFARKIELHGDESMPAVVAVGPTGDVEKARNGLLRQQAGAERRLPWENLFFDVRFGAPLTPEHAGEYAAPLEMLRLGPSASNKQPWRVVKDGDAWHFYMQRAKGYRESLVFGMLKLADLQRVDMGIAMCHFALAAEELGLKGSWSIQEPAIEKPDQLMEYTISWVQQFEKE